MSTVRTTIHCPRCGTTVDGAGLSDISEIHCLKCRKIYSPADGQIWNVRVTEVISTVSRWVNGMADYLDLDREAFKAAVSKGFSEIGWGDHADETLPEMVGRVMERHG